MNKNHVCIPLVAAAESGNINALSQLLQEKVAVNEQCECKKTALHWAADFHGANGYPKKILPSLLEANADVNLVDAEGFSPLAYAAKNALCLKAIEAMIKYADADNIERSYEAAKQGYMDDTRDKIIKYLADKLPATTQKIDIAKSKGIITAIKQLVDDYIQPLYCKRLTTEELEKAVLSLKGADKNHDLPDFRSGYQGQNRVKALLTWAEKQEHKCYDEAVRKYDEEITPTLDIMKHLETKGEAIDSVEFIKEDNKEHDVLLILSTGETLRLELTRAINGYQENLKIQKLRQDGFVLDDYSVECAKQGRYVQNYITDIDNSYDQMLLNAFNQKVKKQKQKIVADKPAYDWLSITIRMKPWDQPDSFLRICAIFYQSIIQKQEEKPVFKRIFILRMDEWEKEGQLLKTKQVWDSKYLVSSEENKPHI